MIFRYFHPTGTGLISAPTQMIARRMLKARGITQIQLFVSKGCIKILPSQNRKEIRFINPKRIKATFRNVIKQAQSLLKE